jgi:YD repeat-containing protein
MAVTRPPSGAVTWAYNDVLGRTIRTRVRGFSGDIIETGSKTFDQEGRVEQETKPRIEGQGATFATVMQYDALGRISTTTQDLGVIDETGNAKQDVVTYTYDGATITTEHNVAGQVQSRTETKNVIGKIISVRDANGVEVTYKYDADGNVTDTIDPAGNTIHVGYDLRGRKTSMRDPDMGEWTYGYGGFGDLTSQTDAKGQTTSMTYDALGRMTSKTDAAGTANWVYDAAPGAGVGKLAAVAGAPDSRLAATCAIPFIGASTNRRAGRSFKYTALGQLEEVSECVDGETFQTGYEYDSAGRQSVLRYPAVRGSRLAVSQHYSSTGYLHYVTDVADGKIYWAARAVNALGQVTDEYTRNSVSTVNNRNGATGWLMGSTSTANADSSKVIQQWANTFDEVGNLRSRRRTGAVVAADSLETFTYDLLNRVTGSRVQVPTETYDVSESYGYDQLGNLTAKAGQTYSYQGCIAGNRAAGPHAVCTVAGSPFTYDLNGNMESGAGRAITYTAQNKPSRFAQGTTSVDLIYGADADRVVQIVAGAASARTLYIGMGSTGKSVYERTTRGSSTEHVQFIYAGNSHNGNAFALRVTTDEAPSRPATRDEVLFVRPPGLGHHSQRPPGPGGGRDGWQLGQLGRHRLRPLGRSPQPQRSSSGLHGRSARRSAGADSPVTKESLRSAW